MPGVSAAFLELVNLASERLGAEVVSANDDFFGPKENLIKPEPPVSIEGRFTDRGKWADGWETRRRREAGHDWCVVRLIGASVVRGVDVDTSFFKGNHPEACALDGCQLAGRPSPEELSRATWRELMSRMPLEDLYLADGVYHGWNWRAIAATGIGCALAWVGLVVPVLKPLYDYAWFVGFFAAGAAHLALTPRTARLTAEWSASRN